MTTRFDREWHGRRHRQRIMVGIGSLPSGTIRYAAGDWPVYQTWLFETDLPKLFFWADPGAIISPARAALLSRELKSCKSVPLGAGRHYVQEDHPDLIGREIAAWLRSLPSNDRAAALEPAAA